MTQPAGRKPSWCSADSEFIKAWSTLESTTVTPSVSREPDRYALLYSPQLCASPHPPRLIRPCCHTNDAYPNTVKSLLVAAQSLRPPPKACGSPTPQTRATSKMPSVQRRAHVRAQPIALCWMLERNFSVYIEPIKPAFVRSFFSNSKIRRRAQI